MIFAILATLAAVAISGVLAFGGVVKQGPIAFATTYAVGRPSLTFHRFAAFALVALICGHLIGVMFETAAGDAGLVAAMISGRKKTKGNDVSALDARARPLAAAIVFLLAVSAAAYEIVVLSTRPAMGVPAEPLASEYVKECGGCHLPFPPSLGVKARWTALMTDLTDHFDEDASLDPKAQARILEYLNDNCAEKWDTRAAHEFAPPNSADPLRIIATRAWREAHQNVPEAVFKSEAVRSKSACNACHTDAMTGRFDPQDIHNPEFAAQ